jgi:hypothetical protein
VLERLISEGYSAAILDAARLARCESAEGEALMYLATNRGLGGSVTGTRVNCANPLTIDTLSEAKACWCLQFPALCSTATIQAAQALINPDQVISPILEPPHVPAVSAGTSTAQVPYPCSDGSLATAATNCPAYNGAIDAVIAQQQQAWKDQNAATIAETQANLDAINAANPPWCLSGTATQAEDGTWSCPSPLGIPTWAWLAIAVVGAVALSGADYSSRSRR